MATLTNNLLDMNDVFVRQNKYGKGITDTIEALHTLNPMYHDALWTECNSGQEHERLMRLALPEPAWGKLYQGTPYSKSEKQKVKDATGFIELNAGCDDRLLKDFAAEDAASVREAEAEPTLEAIAQMAQQAIIYGNIASNPLGIQGLAPRYSSLTGGGPSDYIINGGGAGADNTSIWFVTWGRNQTTLLYPKGTAAGVDREDMGKVPVTDATGVYWNLTERFRQQLGVSVGDYRYNCRIANVDVSDMRAGTVDIIKLMVQAYYKMEKRRNTGKKNGGMISPGKTVIYMNREVKQALHLDSSNKRVGDNFIRLNQGQQEGQEMMSFLEMPIVECDGILLNEAVVV
jgi:hypothetical protein